MIPDPEPQQVDLAPASMLALAAPFVVLVIAAIANLFKD
jgi:hypothetical protein